MIFKKIKLLSLVICLAILTTSCGNPEQTEVDISTAVAQTVQAQNSLTKVAALPTLTPAPAIQASTQGHTSKILITFISMKDWVLKCKDSCKPLFFAQEWNETNLTMDSVKF